MDIKFVYLNTLLAKRGGGRGGLRAEPKECLRRRLFTSDFFRVVDERQSVLFFVAMTLQRLLYVKECSRRGDEVYD